jgi:hypothetical protein
MDARQMTKDEYRQAVINLATSLLRKDGITTVCLDTIDNSYVCDIHVAEAARRVVDDSLYWSNAY